MSDRIQFIQPEHFAAPRGYANGVVCTGRVLFVGGQIGWDPATCTFETDDFVAQFARALDNVIAVVEAAGGVASDVVRMTVFVTDLDAYRSGLQTLGGIWRERFGKHYPAMALVAVSALVERRAKVEIEAFAALEE